MNLHLFAKEIEISSSCLLVIYDGFSMKYTLYVYVGEAFVSDWFLLAFTV